MSIQHCFNCDRDIDTDYNAEHFEECKDSLQVLVETLTGKEFKPFTYGDNRKFNELKELRVKEEILPTEAYQISQGDKAYV